MAMALTSGTKLGPYEVVSPLGAGGMGEVYRARDARLERDVALKVLPTEFAASAERLRRFTVEARAASALNHPNLISVFDVGEESGTPYVVMELLEGETLRAAIAGGPMPEKRAIAIAKAAALGLSAAHEKGIVHRDLKPENIFLTRDARVKILDFGLARRDPTPEEMAERQNLPTRVAETEPGQILGTMGYMSPEQVRGVGVDARSDVFSLGVVLYEMLSGKRPFHGDTPSDVLSAILRDEPAPLTASGRPVSAALERTVRRCLEKVPAERLQSARDLAFRLEDLEGPSLGSMPSGGEAVVVPVPVRAPKKASRALVWTLGVSLALALAALAVVSARLRTPPAVPLLRALTFQAAQTRFPRFSPDGTSFVYASRMGTGPYRIQQASFERPDFRILDLPPAIPLEFSSKGDLAVRLLPGDGRTAQPGVLALTSLTGGAPRPLAEDVLSAAFSPDGATLAATRRVAGKGLLEYPLGTVIYEVDDPMRLGAVDVSPDGETVAVVQFSYVGSNTVGHVVLVPKGGGPRHLGSEMSGILGVRFSPDGTEILYDGTSDMRPPSLWAATLKGDERRLYSSPTGLALGDVAVGRALVDLYDTRSQLLLKRSGDAPEVDITWLDASTPADLADDGSRLLFGEGRGGGGPEGSVYLRDLGTLEPPVRLGDGVPLALSKSVGSALARRKDGTLTLLPTGAGEARPFPVAGLAISEADFFPGDRAVLLVGGEPGKPGRAHVLALGPDLAPSGEPRPLSKTNVLHACLSGDGAWVAATASSPNGLPFLIEVATGEVRPIDGAAPGEVPVRFDAKGRLVLRLEEPGLAVLSTVDPATGRRAPAGRVPFAGGSLSLFLSKDLGTRVTSTWVGRSQIHLVTELPLTR